MIAEKLLTWYDLHARDLPWRLKADRAQQNQDPYKVWLSEIMLQQTTVPTVKSYYAKFLAHYPTIFDMAAAPLESILKDWAGLGYYARARNLHKCAQTIVSEHNGQFPQTYDALLALPGIGPYTAAAIASIAFGVLATVVDGNVERVVSRLFAIETPLPRSRPEIREKTSTLTPQTSKGRPGDFAQAMMDLGARICTPKNPKCGVCPLQSDCTAHKKSLTETLPKKQPKKERPVKKAAVFWLEDPKTQTVWMRRRAPKGMLGGMPEFPSSEWVETAQFDLQTAMQQAKDHIDWDVTDTSIRHTFTHFHLELLIVKGTGPAPANESHAITALEDAGLPTLMKKVWQAAQ